MKQEDGPLRVGDVVQLAPGAHAFGGCFMLVTEPKVFGAQGFVAVPQSRGEPPGEAYFRATWEQMERIGSAVFVPGHVGDGEDVP